MTSSIIDESFLYSSGAVPHHLQQLLRLLYRFLAMGYAQLLVQVTDMGFDGGSRHVQFAGNLIVAVAGINQPQNLPFALRQRAGADQFRYLWMS
jgi:hypothetical protein